MTELTNVGKPILKIFCFAFLKLYLYHYIQIAKPEDQTCVSINDILCKQEQIHKNLRFYCLKLLRLKQTVNNLSANYVIGEMFSWCGLFKNELYE